MKRLFAAVKAPLFAAGRAYNEVAIAHPMRTGIITTVVKTSAADLFAQKVRAARVAAAAASRCALARRAIACRCWRPRTPLTQQPTNPTTATQVLEKREEVDWRRHGVFCTFGLFYLVRVVVCARRARAVCRGERERERAQGCTRRRCLRFAPTLTADALSP